MSLKKQIFDFLTDFLKSGQRLTGNTGAKISSALIEKLTPSLTQNTKYGSIRFYCPSPMTIFRAESLLTKEPETLEWIDSFA